ncbi:MAG: diguanylate cyclase [Planctomycetota bacterium]|nr:diguanylate cyclase [Planctomycetota bacterium]MDA1161859.1 diguanylate cyclase [Planctomycetota bacterium]
MTQKVLAIDDSPEIHQLLKVRLKNLDVELSHAHCGLDGFDQALGTNPDLILLDVMMPDTSGFDVCRKLKATSETRNIPVIFLTGASDVDQKVLGFDVGAVDYIQKPFDSAELNARVRAALRTKRFQDMLAQRAMIDGLTGLWNRAHFDQRMHEEVAAAARYSRPMSLIMMDVDKFKNLNDSHGHPFGDEVLQAVGDVLQQTARTTDWPCRYGGEEFGLILRETDLDGAVVMAERVRASIEGLLLRNKSQMVPVTASFGVVATTLCMNPCDLSPQWIIESADRALYAAKESGRNRVCIAARQ